MRILDILKQTTGTGTSSCSARPQPQDQRCLGRTCHSNMSDPEASSPSPRQAAEDAHRTLAALRISFDGDQNGRPNFKPAVNGFNGRSGSPSSPRSSGDFTGSDRASILQQELDRVKEEKDALQTQYQNLVTRLNSMRTTLGNKLKQDAVCLSPNFRISVMNERLSC